MKRLVLVLILLWPVAVMGQKVGVFYVGNELMELCEGTDTGEPKENIPKYNECVKYLSGISDATSTWQAWGNILPMEICVATGVTFEQLRQVFLKFMRQRPEEWHLAAASLMLSAYQEAWPCQSTPTKADIEKAIRTQNRTFQCKLNRLGYDAGPEDGVWGERSIAAWAAFFADHIRPNQRKGDDVSSLIDKVFDEKVGSVCEE